MLMNMEDSHRNNKMNNNMMIREGMIIKLEELKIGIIKIMIININNQWIINQWIIIKDINKIMMIIIMMAVWECKIGKKKIEHFIDPKPMQSNLTGSMDNKYIN